MPGMFIDVEVDPEVAEDAECTAKLAEVCPVGIFAAVKGQLRIVEENIEGGGNFFRYVRLHMEHIID